MTEQKNDTLRNVVLAVIATVAFIAIVVSCLVVPFVLQVGVGAVTAAKQCGINIFSTAGESKPATLPTLLPTPTQSPTPSPSPTVSGEFGPAAVAYFSLFSASQQESMKKIIASIVSIGKNRASEGITEHDVQAALGVAQKESNFTNHLVATDHDSLGVYQQRPSAIVWGTAQEIIDPIHAINAFYDGMLRNVPSAEERKLLPLVELGILVQNPNRGYYRSGWISENIEAVSADLMKMYWSGSNSPSMCVAAAGVATGEWQLPLGADSYCVTYGFGLRSGGQHNGVDMSCNSGDPIYATADGTVEVAGPDGGYGTHVTINHGGGVVSGYGHMIAGSIPSGVSPGAQVHRGQVIGYVGNTGHSFGAHLHFEIIINGEYEDPEPFMRDKGVPLR